MKPSTKALAANLAGIFSLLVGLYIGLTSITYTLTPKENKAIGITVAVAAACFLTASIYASWKTRWISLIMVCLTTTMLATQLGLVSFARQCHVSFPTPKKVAEYKSIPGKILQIAFNKARDEKIDLKDVDVLIETTEKEYVITISKPANQLRFGDKGITIYISLQEEKLSRFFFIR